MKKNYKGLERRKFLRLNFSAPLAYKVCKKKTVSKLLEGYTANISQSGLLCNVKSKVKKDDLLWLCFNRDVLKICADLEKSCLVYQNGIIGKVVRVKHKSKDRYDVGIQFVTRKEQNLTNIYPKVYFLQKKGLYGQA